MSDALKPQASSRRTSLDPRNLKPADLARLLNSTPLGVVIDERQLYRHRMRAGFRIGDGRHIDLLRYTAWLFEQHHAPRRPADPQAGYEALKERAAARNRALSEAGRDIGDLPAVADPGRKERAQSDFQFFCTAYFPRTFHLPWSPDHLKVMARIEQAVIHGGLFAMAMPRGSGKALALDTPLPTPAGWTTMGDVRIGDTLFDEQGIQCRVVYATEVQYGRPCYRVAFSDGETIVCDADHLWTVHDRYARRNPKTLRTVDMAGRILLSSKRAWPEHRYRIPLSAPIQTQGGDLPLPPYSLGVWLGNGSAASSAVTLHANDIGEFQEHVRHDGEALDARRGRNQDNMEIRKPGMERIRGFLIS